jgi:hypothetical protein
MALAPDRTGLVFHSGGSDVSVTGSSLIGIVRREGFSLHQFLLAFRVTRPLVQGVAAD